MFKVVAQSVTPRSFVSQFVRPRLARAFALLASFALLSASPAFAVELVEVENLYRTGQYDECARRATEWVSQQFWAEDWITVKIQAELARGKFAEAIRSLETGLRRFPASADLHWLGYQVFREAGRQADAEKELDTIERLVVGAPYRFNTPHSRVALGRFFLHRGADARKVLDQFYDVAIKQQPDLVDAYIATAELALLKQDSALAAATLQKAPKDASEDPRFHYLLALAFSDDDRAQSEKALAQALKINPRHVDSLLLKADHKIDSEQYNDASDLLKQVFDVNRDEPRAWAYKAVLAHLKGDTEGEQAARREALARWSTNPEVDHIIGRELSRKYRFAEGADAQRRSLVIDPQYTPAKTQLCQDLLRLGQEEEGWQLADEIFAKDGYNVVAYNLVTLRDHLAKFRTLEDDGFLVRMDAREADLYGPRVLSLLRQARKTLCERYGVTLHEPVIVEIFPQKKDFAVRTFGLPGAEGFLGVCFGRVITANSPASQGAHPSNWEAVLWHEFCHVVTLTKTHNKMPRWLSEGISVFEEARQDPAWGESMNPQFRKMILGKELTPLSGLSSAFLAPESALHLQFAYFESALAVEFLVERFGLPALKEVLDDLGASVPINETLPRRSKMSLDLLDREFTQYARKRAERIAPTATWEDVDLPASASADALEAWLKAHPKSFRGWQRLATRLIADRKWPAAKDALETLKSLYPEYVGPENAYMLLATVYRNTANAAAEHAVLDDLIARNASAADAYLRLMELDDTTSNWRNLAQNARKLLAVNPLIPAPYRQLGRAAEALGQRDDALAAYRGLVLLDDSDPADLHFHLAQLLKQAGKPVEARREVLKSLEEAPRFQAAHRLLLEIVESEKEAPKDEMP